MFIKETIPSGSIAHGFLREKLIQRIKKSSIVKRGDINEDELRKRLLEDIRKGELVIHKEESNKEVPILN